MSNAFATTSVIAKESLAILENKLGFAANVNRDFEDEFTSNMNRGYAPGAIVNIKKPPRYTYRAGRVAQPQGTTQPTIPLQLSQGGADLFVTAQQRTLDITSETWQKMLISAMATVANEIDAQGLRMAMLNTHNSVGTPGTPPTTAAAALGLITDANARLDAMGAPRDDERSLALSPWLNGQLMVGLSGLFNNSAKLSRQYDRGVMVDSLGLAYFMDQNIPAHTNGTQPSTGGTVAGAGQSGSSIAVTGASITGTITRGSIVTFAGVFAVNPMSRGSTGDLAQFVVTADVAAGATVLPISPALVPTGAFQNVTNSPANLAAITVVGAAGTTYTSNISYHRDAFTLAMVPMWKPTGLGVKVAQETHKGLTLKVTEVYDGKADECFIRIDALFGWAAPYPELATRVLA